MIRTSRVAAICALVAVMSCADQGFSQTPLALGSRLELFVDDYLIDRMTGDATQMLQRPEPKEVVLVTNQPWEGNTCAYYTIFQDGDLYRMYYRGSHHDEKNKKLAHPQVVCYAESRDGIHWTKPELGLCDWKGSKKNNILWDGLGTHNFTPFRDPNPECKEDARYKALAGGYTKGLWAFQAADAIHWKLIREDAVITRGAFDSQNLAFWDPNRKLYVDYHRMFRDGVRDIMTCTSPDFVHWTEPEFLKYPGAPKQHLYTNAIRVYDRAPHLYIGFPTRFLPAKQQVEPILMTSRDGLTFHRWNDALIPRDAPEDRDGNRSNYMANGLVQLPGNDRQLAVYATEAYYAGPDSRLRRFMYRIDGFVSVHGGSPGGELVTKPLTFSGSHLVVNFQTRDGGSLRVEVQHAAGQPIKGFELSSCQPLSGDQIAQPVSWRSGASLSDIAGTPVRLRFTLKDADLYSIRFRD